MKKVNEFEWVEGLRNHYAIASVGSSTLMHQSGKGRNERSQNYLLTKFPLNGLSDLSGNDFLNILDGKTGELSLQLPRPSDGTPNWGAARKVLNIYLRLCAMNKDICPYYDLEKIECFFEVPLDNHIVKEIDKKSGKKFSRTFKILDLAKTKSDEIQEVAKSIALQNKIHRYELDVIFWNHKKINA